MADKGRPVEYTPERLEEIREALEEYIDNTPIPIIAEFAYMNHIRRATLYEMSALSYTVKRCTDKKEANLQRGGLDGTLTPSMAIFSLKQLGWKDKVEVSGDKENPLELKINRVIVEPGEITDLGELEKDG